MSKLERYLKSIDFLTSEIQTESSFLHNFNKKMLKEIKFYDKNIFIEIENMDINLLEKNCIVFYPYNIKFIRSINNKLTIPIFIESYSPLISLLTSKKIKFKEVCIKDIETELNEKERLYYYQERVYINLLKTKR